MRLDARNPDQNELATSRLYVKVGLTVAVVVLTRSLLDPEGVRLDVDQKRARPERRGGVDDPTRLRRSQLPGLVVVRRKPDVSRTAVGGLVGLRDDSEARLRRSGAV